MRANLYSHRLKTVLQHTVVELGVTMSIDDEGADLSLAESEAVLRETADMLRIKVTIEKNGATTTATFYR
ncbi:hypothetical protein C8N43_2153 [Litoreibacter ponti]|uniref:Uncharacterized protein n=1 Tax=Litoreibacter ponti TaxID=1510457 RepID=A0A2T6BN30_9RHOB|nr:hypothetical protein [Litoreibacter ponti]PTX57483.1 hypothetical protein C8N43_2153 [Litoreibacter ponti]